jgi:hypothetical protein
MRPVSNFSMIVAGVFAVLFAFVGAAQAEYVWESFTGSSAPDWTFVTAAGDGPILTGDGTIDPVDEGWLRLTADKTNQNSFIYYNNAIPTQYGLRISFDFVIWSSTSSIADGFALVLFDAQADPVAAGGWGGSLGYAQHTSQGNVGLNGGIAGFGFDTFGNFSRASEGRIGGPGQSPHSIAIRGSMGATRSLGYEYQTGVYDLPVFSTGSVSSRTSATVYSVCMTISTDRKVSIEWKPEGGAREMLLEDYECTLTCPQHVMFGFTGSTGSVYSNQEIRNVVVTPLQYPLCYDDDDCPDGYRCVDEECRCDFTYFVSDDTVTITGYVGSDTDVVIPSTIYDMPVVSVGAWAFYGRSDLTSVSIPASVVSIGAYSFSGCSGLTGAAIAEGVERIEAFAFYQCSALTGVSVPASVTEIGLGAFSRCASLASISVHADNPNYSSLNGVLYNKNQTLLIQYPSGKAGAFSIPAGVSEIEQGAFAFGNYLTSVDMPASVFTIGRGAFSSCASLTAINVDAAHPLYSSLDCVFYNKDQSILALYPSGKSGAFIIPGTVTRILDGAFAGCTNLTGITIPSSVTRIGDVAFESCTALTEIAIPDSVTLIGRGLFYNCTALASVTLGSGISSIPDGIIFDVEIVGMFAGCTALESIMLPSDITRIGNYAFYGCSALDTAYFLGDAPDLGSNVFTGTDPGFSVCYIDGAADFTNPWNGYPAGECYPVCADVDECPEGFDCVSNECRPDMGCDDDSDCPEGYTCVQGECQNIVFTYSVAGGTATITGYTGTGSHLVIPSEIAGLPVVAIGSMAFMNNTAVQTVSIPEGVVSIDSYAFYGCSALTSVVMPDSVTVIGNRAFTICYNLRDAVLSANIVSIGPWAFYRTALSSIAISESVTSIGRGAFVRCTGLTGIEVAPENHYYSSADGVLYDKTQSVLIQYPLAAGGSFTIPGTVVVIGDYSFEMSALASVIIPDTVETIGLRAFRYCWQLTQVRIGSGVQGIDDEAFFYSFRLSEAYFAGDAPALMGTDVFTRAHADFMVCCTDGSAGFDQEPWLSYNVQVCACVENSDCDAGYACAQGFCVPDESPEIYYGPVPTDRAWMWYGMSQDVNNPTPMQPVVEAIGWLYADDYGACIANPYVSGSARYRVPGAGSWTSAPVVHWRWADSFATHLNDVPPGVYEFEVCVTDCADQTVCSGVKYIEIVE